MYRLGLRNRRGGKFTLNGFSIILNNPFYIGLIELRRTGEIFPGCHQPLISKSLFDQGTAGLRRAFEIERAKGGGTFCVKQSPVLLAAPMKGRNDPPQDRIAAEEGHT